MCICDGDIEPINLIRSYNVLIDLFNNKSLNKNENDALKEILLYLKQQIDRQKKWFERVATEVR